MLSSAGSGGSRAGVASGGVSRAAARRPGATPRAVRWESQLAVVCDRRRMATMHRTR